MRVEVLSAVVEGLGFVSAVLEIVVLVAYHAYDDRGAQGVVAGAVLVDFDDVAVVG